MYIFCSKALADALNIKRTELQKVSAAFIKEAILYTMEVGGFNNPEIDKYMSGIGEIVFAEKLDRQMTSNLTRMFQDMEYMGYRWIEDGTVQAEQLC